MLVPAPPEADATVSVSTFNGGFESTFPVRVSDGAPGRNFRFTLGSGKAVVDAGSIGAGRHTVRLSVADYQETKNMEDVLRIRPNTRDYTARFKVP